MELPDASRMLLAIGHQTRLQAYRLLMQAGPSGLAAGQLALDLDMPPSSLSFHLKELSQVGLITARQQGRYVIYATAYSSMAALMQFLTDNCCGGNPCLPVTTEICSPEMISGLGRPKTTTL